MNKSRKLSLKNLMTEQLATLLDNTLENNIVTRDKATLKEIYKIRFQGGLGLDFFKKSS